MSNIPPITPAKKPFALPTPALTAAIAAEWFGQQKFSAAKMPLTSLAYTAIDRIEPQKAAVVEALLVFLDTDTLSYRAVIPSPLAGEGQGGGAESSAPSAAIPHPHLPPQGGKEKKSLAQLQVEHWDPVLTWAAKKFGATWQVTSGVMPVDQSPGLHKAIGGYLSALDSMKLAAASVLASLYSSLVLAVAVVDGHLDAMQAFALSRLEEQMQEEQWGKDEEAEKRKKRLEEEVGHTSSFLNMLDGGGIRH